MMPRKQTSKFAEPSDLTGEWLDCRELHFWHDQDAFAVKRLIEKMTGALFQRDALDAEHLTYAGTSDTGNRKCGLRLRFEAVIESRNLYALQMESRAPRKWVTEESFLRDVERAHEYWGSQLTLAGQEIDRSGASPALFLQRKQESLALESEAAARVEGPAPITAIQKVVLAALRAGREFRSAHKEGGTILSFHGSSFIRTDYGEEPNRETFPSDEDMLVCLRHFYDWESRRDMFPHRPPELDVWRYIQSQLSD